MKLSTIKNVPENHDPTTNSVVSAAATVGDHESDSTQRSDSVFLSLYLGALTQVATCTSAMSQNMPQRGPEKPMKVWRSADTGIGLGP